MRIHSTPLAVCLCGVLASASPILAGSSPRRSDQALVESSDVIVTLTRTFANALGLADGGRVWLEPEQGAMTVPVLAAAPQETPGKATSTAA